MSDFKKATNILLKLGQRFRLRKSPNRRQFINQPRVKPTVAPGSNPIQAPKPNQPKTIKFDETGKPIIPKQYLTETGVPKDPKQLKAQVLKDYKQHLLNQKALLDKSINIAKTQSQLKTSIERALLLEKITSIKTKVALSIVGGISFFKFCFKRTKANFK